MSPLQRLAWAYAAIFAFVTVVGLVPAFADDQGLVLGLFALDGFDNALHAASGIWAATAAAWSASASRTYFRAFGVLYLLDGLMGLAFGSGYLDAGILVQGVLPLPWSIKIPANLPHITLGTIAVVAGFLWRPSRALARP